jgi:tetratricopeptide (TPR) repeat protein
LLPLTFLVFSGCARQGPQGALRLAILPFENLSGDPELDWMRRGFPEVIRLQLTGVPGTNPATLLSLRDAPASGATRLVHGYFQQYRGRLQVHAGVEDARTHRTLETIYATAPAGGFVAAAATLSEQLDAAARPPGTRNPDAVRFLIEGLESVDAGVARQAFDRAIAADPGFGAAHVAWVEWLAARGDREGALAAIASAARREVRIAPIERARLRLLGARLEGERRAQRPPLVELARLTPADADVFRALAEIDLTGRLYREAAGWYRRAAGLEPENAPLLNQLGYALAYAGDLEAAVEALSRYRELRPKEANPLDSLGDVHYRVGRFSEAEKYYLEAHARQPAFLLGGALYKAAWARLMTGDVKGADAFFGRFLKAREKDPLLVYRQAQWEFLSGRRQQALARAAKFAGQSKGPAAALAACQLTIWHLVLGDAPQARRYAAQVPPANPALATCKFLADPSGPAPAGADARELALGCARLLAGDFKEAAPRLREARRRFPPSAPEPVDVLLAWALVETGRHQEARELVSTNPIPEVIEDRPLFALSFPRLLALRAAVEEKSGRLEEARRLRELYARLSGPS